MGLFSSIGSFFGGVASAVGSVVDTVGGWLSSDSGSSSGGSSRSYRESSSVVTHLDPDKVRAEELANQRVELMANAQKELMELNAKMEIGLMEARHRGSVLMQEALLKLMREVNSLAEERMLLLEKGSFENIQRVEELYRGLAADIQNNDFMKEKLPELLKLAEQFPEDSPAQQMYMKGIEQEMVVHMNFKAQQLSELNARCRAVVESVLSSKERMEKHLDEVVRQRIEYVEQQIEKQIALSQHASQHLINHSNKALADATQSLPESESGEKTS